MERERERESEREVHGWNVGKPSVMFQESARLHGFDRRSVDGARQMTTHYRFRIERLHNV
jgi:hypothetical protein